MRIAAKIVVASRRGGAYALNHATRVLTSTKLGNRYSSYYESLTGYADDDSDIDLILDTQYF